MAKRGTYGKWNEADLQLAVAAYKNGDVGLNECSRVYGVPKATIKRHADSKNAFSNTVKCFGRQATFSAEMEKVLVDHILLFEERFLGFTIKDVRKLAFDIAEKLGLSHTFNKEKRIAGKKWFYSFMRRNPHLSLRQPEGTSMARAKGFNRENVNHFFNLLEKTVDDYKLTANIIFNVDESGFTTVQKRQQKVIAQKGKHQVGVLTSGERGVNTTVVCAANAAGFFIPPMIIFKRKRKPQELEIDAPPGSVVVISDTGYINSELFVQWLKHFKTHVNCSKDSPVLLLLDGHTTHSRNLEAVLYARDNGIILLQLPGHTTHRLQPLDVAFFAPLQTYFIQAQDKWMRQNIGKTISQFQISGLFNEAYGRAASVGTAESAFRAAGIWPVNRNVFEDHHFAPADTLLTEESLTDKPTSSKRQNEQSSGTESSSEDDSSGNNSRHSKKFKRVLNTLSPVPKPSSSVRSVRLRGKPQSAVLISSSPYKYGLEQSKNLQTKPKPEKTALFSGKNKEFENSSWFCALCSEVKEEDMIQCMDCRSWVHTRCANVKPRIKRYFCPNCK